MFFLLKLLCTILLVELCMTLPTHFNVASNRAPTGDPIVASPEDLSSEGAMPEDDTVLEGDIVIGSEIVPLIEFRSGHSVRNLVADPRLLWPARTVYYQLPSSVDDDDGELAAAVDSALRQITAVSCVRFAPTPPGQKTYLKLRGTGKGCATKVGYHEKEGVLDLHVGGAKCHTRGTIQHEFLHALGFWHEHTRADRDKYVSVVWDNVKSDYKTNFLKRSEMESFNLGLPYDYASVMHYKTTSFAKHRKTPTLVPKNKDAVKVMGQRRGVTWVDIAKLNRLYNCSNDYYSGVDLKSDGAVFGKLVETGVETRVFEKDTFNSSGDENKKRFQEVDSLSEGKNKEKEELNINNEKRLLTQDLKQNPNLANKNPMLESVMKIDREEKRPRKFKRETNAPASQPTGNSGMADKPPPNGGHENFTPQRILPELLKGVLDNDGNNERPIVIQFAIYQPVIYRNENKTDNPDEGNNDNNPKQSDDADRFFNRQGNNSNQRDKQSTQRDSNREPDKFNRNSQDYNRERENINRNSQENREQDKYNRNSQDYNRERDNISRPSQGNREQDKYNRNSQDSNRERENISRNSQENREQQYNRNPQGYTRDQERLSHNSQEYIREQDKYIRNSQQRDENNNRNSQSQYEHDDLALRIPSDNGDYYRRPSYERPSSSQNQYSSPVRDYPEKGYPDKQFMPSQDYSEYDRRTPYERRTEYSSSYQVSQKGGGSFKPPTIDHAPSLTRPLAQEHLVSVDKENLSGQEVPLRRIASVPKSDFQESHRAPLKNDEYIGVSNQDYSRPLQSTETRNDQAANSKKEFIQPPTTPQRRGDEYTPIEKKISPQDSYTTKTEELITPVAQPKYPVDTDFHVASLKDDYGQIKHESELSVVHSPDEHSHLSYPYGSHQMEEHGITDTHDFAHVEFSYDEHHLPETKTENVQSKESFVQPIQNSESSGHFTDTKGVSVHSTDTFVPNNINTNPTKSLREDLVNDPKVAKPLPAKSTEIPLEVGPPKEFQPLVGSGDGENVAPNWKGIIENVPKEEPSPPTFSRESSENFNEAPRLNTPSTETSSILKISNTDGPEIKQGTRPIRRPDLVTEQDKIDDLDKDIRRQKIEKKLLEEAATERPEKVVIVTPAKIKSEYQTNKDIIIPRKIPTITKVMPPPVLQPMSQPSTPTPPPQSKKPSNPRREVQEDDGDVEDADEDLISKPNISRVNLNPRQALPLNANATVRMNLRRLLRKERT